MFKICFSLPLTQKFEKVTTDPKNKAEILPLEPHPWLPKNFYDPPKLLHAYNKKSPLLLWDRFLGGIEVQILTFWVVDHPGRVGPPREKNIFSKNKNFQKVALNGGGGWGFPGILKRNRKIREIRVPDRFGRISVGKWSWG